MTVELCSGELGVSEEVILVLGDVTGGRGVADWPEKGKKSLRRFSERASNHFKTEKRLEEKIPPS